MPVITIHGIPSKYSSKKLGILSLALSGKIFQIKELHLENPNWISIFFVPDLLQAYPGHEIIVFVDLYKNPMRTLTVLKSIADLCTAELRERFATALIECFVRTINPEIDGVSTLPYKHIAENNFPKCPVCNETILKLDGSDSICACANCHEVISLTGN